MLLLRSYSHHSLLSAVPKIDNLILSAKEKGYTSIALTDEETGSGLIEFYETCLKHEIKPVLGSTLKITSLTNSGSTFGRNKQFSKVAVLAKNESGYKSLLRLISAARTEQEEPAYHITFENLQKELKTGNNIFVVLAGNDHELISSLRSNNSGAAKKILESYVKKVGKQNLLVELTYPLEKDREEYVINLNKELIDLCQKHEVKYVASPAPRYLEKSDQETFKIVLAIRDGQKSESIHLQRDFYLPGKAELQKIYSYAPESLETGEIEKEIEIKLRTDYDKHSDEAFFPIYDLPEGQTADQRLTWETYINFLEKFASEEKDKKAWMEEYPYEKLEELKDFAKSIKPWDRQLSRYPDKYWQEQEIKLKEYLDRIEKELGIIVKKGYSAYFLVFSDIMQFCRDNGIVITTRGSAAGSLVGYLLNINILDPLIYNLPFERFLNPMRPSAPDIDGDFADDRRDEVIEYIKNKYGRDKVTQIITFGTMLPRAAVRDVGRALGVTYKKCDRLAKLIPIAPQGSKTTFEWALKTSKELADVYERDEEAGRIINISKQIEGNYRHASSHAAGVIISPTTFTDYAPLQWDTEHEMIVCQYDMKIAEKVGLIKLDILGIRNLAILGNALQIAKERRQKDIDLLDVDIRSSDAFEMLSEGRTMGVFQLSGAAMTRYLVDLQPERVEDLMAMVALYRPGPMANIPEYIRRKKEPQKAQYYVPQMKKWMQSSYGILVYQDDLLYTVIELAGYNWLEADTFRKGVGKKIQSVLESQHIRFVEGCKEHSKLPEAKAEELWQLMVPFAAYGFNKAHASSYGMVAYWTAYMKANYSVEFMTAYMTAENKNLDKIASAINECQEMGLVVRPPDVNKSFDNFTIENDTTIRYGLSSVKNLGSDVIQYMIQERQENGEYQDMDDFLERVSDFQGFNKKSLEALIWSGCFDEIGYRSLMKTGKQIEVIS